MRQIILDTETTGLDPNKGHRIIEIGCVELINRQLTQNYFHVYINPEREIDLGAQQVHGITHAFLKDKPIFKNIVKSFLEFIDEAELIIHNAPFDVGFINHEFKLIDHAKTLHDHCQITDTLVLAKRLHPGQKNNLDALCKRYSIDNRHRELHGALLDANILAQVYLAMTGGQASLFAEPLMQSASHLAPIKIQTTTEKKIDLSVIYATKEELAVHEAFMESIK